MGSVSPRLRHGWTEYSTNRSSGCNLPGDMGHSATRHGPFIRQAGPQMAYRSRHVGPGYRHRLCNGFIRLQGVALGAGLLGLGTAMVYPTLLATVGDIVH